ncbi:MAG: TIGR01212 family radical SAM protein, partial [Erysipelotrichaceae bacterium]|nr:TIGR01212 family radical SAM protein [Erysipelotrichaceae bacterium]
MDNPFVYSFNEKRYHTFNYYLKTTYGCKVAKVILDGGFTCPNRDGSKGRGGCIFCSQKGSGDFVAERNLTIPEQIEQGKKLVEAKLRGRSGERRGKYIAYFQNFTSTYGDAAMLLEKYRES